MRRLSAVLLLVASCTATSEALRADGRKAMREVKRIGFDLHESEWRAQHAWVELGMDDAERQQQLEWVRGVASAGRCAAEAARGGDTAPQMDE